MHFAIFFLTGLFIGLAQAQISTYVLHSSCTAYPKAEQAAQEAIGMANNAVTRINDANDQVTERLFQTIFKQSRAQGNGPKNVFSSIGGFTRLPVDPGANSGVIRIFCDNDSRWVDKVDAGTGDTLKFDAVSRIAIKRSPSCSNLAKTTLGSTYHGVSPRKSSITLCDRLLNRNFATVDQLRGGNPNKNLASLAGKGISDYNIISRTVLHEMTHAWPNRLKDKSTIGGGGPYGWANIFAKPQADALLNSDSHAYFGLISYLNGHKMSDDPTERAAGKVLREVSLAKRIGLAKCRDLTARRADPDCVVQ